MRLGFDARKAFNAYGGLGNYARYVISNISRFHPEHECHLYTPGIMDPDLFAQPQGSRIHRSGKLGHRLQLSGRLSADHIQLYHGLSNELPFGIQRTMVRSAITIHDLSYMELPELYKPARRLLLEKRLEFGVRAASRVIAVSEQTRDDLIRNTQVDPAKIRVVYQGCHRQFYSRVSTESLHLTRQQFALPGDYLLYVGTIEQRKNLLMIVRALHEGGIDLPLVVIGRKTSYYNRVLSYIREKGIKNILFLDQVQVTDLPAIYQGSKCFIYPSTYEGFGIPILEALNSGTPVITSRGGCLEETAGRGGILIDPLDLEEMIAAIRQVLEDGSLRDRLVFEGRSHALKFREEQVIPDLYNVYLECIND